MAVPSKARASLQALQVMRLRDVPVAQPRRLVLVQAEMDAQRHLRQMLGEVRSAGAVKTGLPPRMTQHLDTPPGHRPRRVRAICLP